MEKKHVFHGSSEPFNGSSALPRPQTRVRENSEGLEEVIFDEIAFHATPHRWIALAYTCARPEVIIDGKRKQYSMGVDLYSDTKQVAIYGYGTLEDSLEKMYSSGGYVYHFENDKFLWKEGLGDMEVVSNEPTSPIHVERVENPVDEMKKLGVEFVFFDLALPENKTRGD